LYEKYKVTSYPRSDCEYLPESMAAEVSDVLAALGSHQSLQSPQPLNQPLTDCANRVEGLEGANASALSALLRQSVGLQQRLGVQGTLKLRVFNDKKVTAHHAIIPTLKHSVNLAPMSQPERQVYDLIVRRYLAQFLGNYTYQQTDVTVVCEGESFKARGAVVSQLGWKQCYPPAAASVSATPPSNSQKTGADSRDTEDSSREFETVHLPAVQENQAVRNRSATVRDCVTKPPLRYTEGTLLAAMDSIDKEIDDPRFKAVMKNKEKAGIGTDATRAKIIEGLFDNGFLEPCPTAKKTLSPTAKAYHFIELLEHVAPTVLDPVLTAMWEELLTQVQDGVLTLAQFETTVAAWLAKVVADIKLKASVEPKKPMAKGVATACPKCRQTQLVVTPSTKYPGRHLLCCPSRACGHYEWPKG
jgi:DNA topoisomerase III